MKGITSRVQQIFHKKRTLSSLVKKNLPLTIGGISIILILLYFSVSAFFPEKSTKEDFNEHMTALHDMYYQKYVEKIFSFDIPTIGGSSLNISANMSSPFLGEIDLTSTISKIFDYSENDAPKTKDDIQFFLDFTSSGAPYIPVKTASLDMQMTDIVSDKTLSLLLQKFDFTATALVPSETGGSEEEEKLAPAEEKQISFTAEELLDTWYEMPLPEKQGFDIAYIGKIFDPFDRFAKKIHLWKFEEGLPEKDGMIRFRVSLDEEKVKQILLAYLDLLYDFSEVNGNGIPEAEFLQQKKSLSENFSLPFSISGIFSLSPEDPAIYSFEGVSTPKKQNAAIENIDDIIQEETKISFSSLENQRRFHIQPHGGNEGEVLFLAEKMKDEETWAFSLKGGNNLKETMFEGRYSPKELTLNFSSTPLSDSKDVIIDIQKNDERYSGSISLVSRATVIEIEEAYRDGDRWHLAFDVFMSNVKYFSFNGEAHFSMSPLDEVNISPPLHAEPVENAIEIINGMIQESDFLVPLDRSTLPFGGTSNIPQFGGGE